MLKELKDFLFSFLYRINSKKFLAWMVGTVALFSQYITANEWMVITSIYLSAEGIVDVRRASPQPIPVKEVTVNTSGSGTVDLSV